METTVYSGYESRNGIYIPKELLNLKKRELSNKEDLKELSRHPLIIVIISFMLSGIVGAVISNFFNKKELERNHLFQITAIRRSSIQDFSRLIYLQRSRADMLESSFRRSADIEEIKERKKLYDDAFVEWNSKLQSNLFLIRNVVNAHNYSMFEQNVEFHLVPIFQGIDNCLTQAYDKRLQNQDPTSFLKKCKTNRLLQVSLDCSYAITDELFTIAEPIQAKKSRNQAQLLKKANKVISRRCNSG